MLGCIGRMQQTNWGSAAASRLACSATKSRIDPHETQPKLTAADNSDASVIGRVARRLGTPVAVTKGGKARLFAQGAPLVFNGALDRIVGRPPPRTGDCVVLADGAERVIGWGLYNSVSMYRVRMMQLEEEARRERGLVLDLAALLAARMAAAVALRRALGLPSADTTVYRLINSEGDRLSGLVVDVLGDCVVVASSAAWVELHRPLGRLVWRPSVEMLREEGLEMRKREPDVEEAALAAADGPGDAIDARTADGDAMEETSSTPPAREAPVGVLEAGIHYAVQPTRGQKTGFYADQRPHRAEIRRLAAGARVLDLCCYSGGFALSAAVGGASTVTGVDSSAAALALARANAERNGVADRCQFVKADVAEFMRAAAPQAWDIVVLDPPKLAPSRKALPRASVKYRQLNARALRLVAPGGLLMTCSCSGAVTQAGLLLGFVQEAAAIAGRRVTLLRRGGAAADHPLDPACPEGEYLSNLLFRVM
ncbi:hypothetical protein WJX81_002094 [Elliptochloris bilobata]|uniref:PUA domain-containing protein n=1 Tax=Elliptochloris bilobata TaxID=381761 RepID=A0AAW1RBF2_9CHLO